MRNYGTYQSLRNSSWHCLWDYGAESIPVDVLKIARKAEFRVIKNSSVDILLPSENGRSYFDGCRWHIIYDDTAPTERSRFTLAHELGHIFLGHELQYVKYSHTRQIRPSPISELQANRFAARLLCPAFVLWEKKLYTAEEISRVCHVEMSVAAEREKRMAVLLERNCFLTNPLEKQLHERFFGKKS